MKCKRWSAKNEVQRTRWDHLSCVNTSTIKRIKMFYIFNLFLWNAASAIKKIILLKSKWIVRSINCRREEEKWNKFQDWFISKEKIRKEKMMKMWKKDDESRAESDIYNNVKINSIKTKNECQNMLTFFRSIRLKEERKIRKWNL